MEVAGEWAVPLSSLCDSQGGDRDTLVPALWPELSLGPLIAQSFSLKQGVDCGHHVRCPLPWHPALGPTSPSADGHWSQCGLVALKSQSAGFGVEASFLVVSLRGLQLINCKQGTDWPYTPTIGWVVRILGAT